MTSPLTVIVPVYRGTEETQRCLRSLVTSANQAATDIIVVNDASPEPALSEYCRTVAAEDSLSLIEHQVNQGFVKSVNEAMRLAGTSDVVLLNSDTEVPANWIERISNAAAAHPDAASITPFSNNATICSYPHFGVENALPPGYDTHTLDALFASANKGKTFDIPTGVGFCMFIRRAALEDAGYFDEEAFGLGYGEENDWCLRASSKGWKHLLCADLFVYHSGEVSFGEKARELQANALTVIRERYPQYEQTVARFIEQDPMESARYAVDRLRNELQDVVGEYRDRERMLREAYYALDRLRHEQVTKLDGLIDATRADASAEATRYEALLISQRSETAASGAQYQVQIDEMAEGYTRLEAEAQRLESELHQLNRLWSVRFRRWAMRKLDRQ